MKIMAVDDEELVLESLVKTIKSVNPDAEIISFRRSAEAFSYLSTHYVDIAFLDIEMGDFCGITLAKKCKDLCPAINIIFVTGHSKYMMDAFKIHASGYLLKPVREDDLRIELENLRHPLPLSKHRMRVQTFGNFEVFVDDKPLKMPRSKCKECLAYLIDRRGAGVTYSELSSVLWESQPIGRNIQNRTYKVVSDLMKTLKSEGLEKVILKNRMNIAIDVKKVSCDYFSAIKGDMNWMNTFTGEYMMNYSWAEFTLGELIEIKQRNI